MSPTSHQVGTMELPLRVAIIGAGPAGFFAAGALVAQQDVAVAVDLFDRLPAPFGLVRYGVAPDHPEIKRVQAVFEKTAADPRVRFFGNVALGRDLTREDLLAHYDQVLYAVGAQGDRRLNIPGEDLAGSYSATEFVAWYNGHPDYAERRFELGGRAAVVVGVGNVAMDVARILARTRAELERTDIADHALRALAESEVEDIYVLARRGPAQAKFTTPEIKEFGALADADTVVAPDDLVLDAASAASAAADKTTRRNLEVLEELARRPPTNKRRRVHFRFLVSPTEVLGQEGRVTAVRVVRNRLEADASGTIRCVATGQFETIPCGLVLRSVGYKGVALPEVPYDPRAGTIPNRDGRVVDPASDRVLPGEYVAGWAKRGPSGIIGTNKGCAKDTVRVMLSEAAARPGVTHGADANAAIPALLAARGVQFFTFPDWQRLDALELQRGQDSHRPRVKWVRVEAMLAALR